MGECFMRRARQSKKPFEYTYTGEHTVSDITVNGVEYTLLTLIKSGTLTVNRNIKMEVWMCGGGADGSDGYRNTVGSYPGGGAAGGFIASGIVNVAANTGIACSIGSKSGNSSFGSVSAKGATSVTGPSGGTGGTGGGSAVPPMLEDSSPGKGEGKSTIPFGDNENFEPHCAGGAAGGHRHRWRELVTDPYSWDCSVGGYGGTDGKNGGTYTEKNNQSSDVSAGGTGGKKGGGNGGSGSSKGSNASFYGSGGGGGGLDILPDSKAYPGGVGYQGVIYARFKKEDAA